jgi:hypothetical protein
MEKVSNKSAAYSGNISITAEAAAAPVKIKEKKRSAGRLLSELKNLMTGRAKPETISQPFCEMVEAVSRQKNKTKFEAELSSLPIAHDELQIAARAASDLEVGDTSRRREIRAGKRVPPVEWQAADTRAAVPRDDIDRREIRLGRQSPLPTHALMQTSLQPLAEALNSVVEQQQESSSKTAHSIPTHPQAGASSDIRTSGSGKADAIAGKLREKAAGRTWSAALTLGLSGHSRSGDAPQRSSLPKKREQAADASAGGDLFVALSNEIAETAGALHRRVLTQPFPIEERPVRGMLYRYVGRVLPFIRARKVKQLKTLRPHDAPAQHIAPDRARLEPDRAEMHAGSAIAALCDAAGASLMTEMAAQRSNFALAELNRYHEQLGGLCTAALGGKLPDKAEAAELQQHIDHALSDIRATVDGHKLERSQADRNVRTTNDALARLLKEVETLEQADGSGWQGTGRSASEDGAEIEPAAIAGNANGGALDEKKIECQKLAGDLKKYEQQLSSASFRLRNASRQFDKSAEIIAKMLPAISVMKQATKEVANVAQENIDKKDGNAKAFNEQEKNLLGKLFKSPPGFSSSPSPALDALSRELHDMIEQLPQSGAKDVLPRIAVAELTAWALSTVAQGDPAKAARLLSDLRTHATLDWVPAPNGAAPPQPAPADVCAIFRMMAAKPRGAELLQSIGANHGHLMASAELQALRAFWQADGAHASEPEQSVRRWLEGARSVAAQRLHGSEIGAIDDVVLGAYNAVRNGYTSNAPGTPYAVHNQRMLKMTEQWIQRIDGTQKTLSETLIRNKGKTPFSPQNVAAATNMAESFGITTNRVLADRQIKQTAGALADLAAKGLMTALDDGAGQARREAQLFDRSLLAFGRHLADFAGAHVSDAGLGKRDFDAIRNAVRASMGEAPQHRSKPATAVLGKKEVFSLPPLFEKMAKERSSPADALKAIEEYLTAAAEVPPDVKKKLHETLASADLDAKMRAAELRFFDDKEDLVTFLKPMLQEWDLRNKLKLSSGGKSGVDIPFMPFISPIEKLFASLRIGYSRKDEAFIQMFMPLVGIELSFGETKTYAGEARAALGPSWKLNAHNKLTLALRGKGIGQKSATEGTLLRFLRSRNQDEAQRQDMLNALDSIVRWDRMAPAQGKAYAGPMEALLSRNPDVSISEYSAKSEAKSGEAKLNLAAAAGWKFPKALDALSFSVNGSAGAAATAERAFNSTDEKGGHVAVAGDKASSAKQTATGNMNLTAQLPLGMAKKLGTKGKYGGLGGAGIPGAVVDANRDFAQHLEKHGFSPFSIGGKQDADIDRHYSGPEQMLAELAHNREIWLERCVETLEPDAAGEKDTPDNRARAVQLMENFKQEVRHLGETSQYCQYNLNYSLRGQAAAWIDSLRLGQSLALERGDTEHARRAMAAIDEVLAQPSSFRPLTLIVREKGKDSRDQGVDYVLRREKNRTVEGQRTAAQYPPP